MSERKEVSSSTYPMFETEFAKLLERYGVETYVFTVFVPEDEREGASIRQMVNVVGSAERDTSPARIASTLVEQLAEMQVQMLCRYCGLDVEQAEGALCATASVAARQVARSEASAREAAQNAVFDANVARRG